jgi:uncharacterized protein (TIGR01777 family)
MLAGGRGRGTLGKTGRKMARILISGASGLVGTALCECLRAAGQDVYTLVRRPPRDAHEVPWHDGVVTWPPAFACDAVVHLAGEPIVGLWTAAKRRRIRESRVGLTRALSEQLAGLGQRPRTLISASAVGYYGSRGDERLTETSPPGTGFLPETCRDWEAATQPAREAGIRVVNLRIGIVLSARGGMLKTALPGFRLGLGSRLGDGRGWFPWIALEDLLRVIEHAMADETLAGAVNAVAPEPVTNAGFTRSLARALHRPTFVPIPAPVLRLLPGHMAEEALLASAHVVPEKLLQTGFTFLYPRLDEALKAELG